MAWQVRRPGRKGVYIKYFDLTSYKEEWLPREHTRHLDGQPQEVVEAWVEAWNASHGQTRARSDRIHLKETERLSILWDQYQRYRAASRKRRAGTAATESELFQNHIAPFFVGLHHSKNPARWHDRVPDFHTHLFNKKLSDRTIQKILWTLERFGKHLVFTREMVFPFVVQVPARGNSKVTPLKTRRSPKDILQVVRNTTWTYEGIDFSLAILLGYFGALSPSELFALSREDFLTGEAATSAATYGGFQKEGLGTRLSLRITKTLEGAEPVELTKNDYRRGVVNIWSPEAAKLIAKRMAARGEGRLFPFSRGWLERAWRQYVAAALKATPHDLRRASALYLGREKRIPLTLLQEHMRHAEIATTMLYTREPSVPEKERMVAPDFSDI